MHILKQALTSTNANLFLIPLQNYWKILILVKVTVFTINTPNFSRSFFRLIYLVVSCYIRTCNVLKFITARNTVKIFFFIFQTRFHKKMIGFSFGWMFTNHTEFLILTIFPCYKHVHRFLRIYHLTSSFCAHNFCKS